MNIGSSENMIGPDADKEAARAAAGRSIIANLFGLIVPVLVLVFWFGGNSTRAWILGFVWGLFGLSGQPSLNLADEPSASVSRVGGEASKPPLKLLGHGCHKEYGYQICEGEVRNETADRLTDVVVEIKFKDAYGTFVKAESSIIDYQPLMPGQSSPFKVMASDNPLIRHYAISFRQMFGGELKASR